MLVDDQVFEGGGEGGGGGGGGVLGFEVEELLEPTLSKGEAAIKS